MIMRIILLILFAENLDGKLKCQKCISLSDYHCKNLEPQVLNHLTECENKFLPFSEFQCSKVVIQVAIELSPVVWRDCVLKGNIDFCYNPDFPPEIRSLVSYVHSCNVCETDGCNHANINKHVQHAMFASIISVVFLCLNA